MSKLKIFDISWTSHTAGPSPIGDNNRTELFLMGCQKAESGDPCKGCFNQRLWKSIPDAREIEAKDAAENIMRYAPTKYLTIVGGEPLDQIDGVTELCQYLKAEGFHIVLITHYLLGDVMASKIGAELLRNIDILIDGEYDERQRIYDESRHDGLHNTVGSANQMVWDLEAWNSNHREGKIDGVAAGDIYALYVCPDGSLRYIINDKAAAAAEESIAV